MKSNYLLSSIFLLLILFNSASANKVRLTPEQLCEPNHFTSELLSLNNAHKIDVNSDSVNELLVHIQYNNNARFHLFYLDDCGLREVTDKHGEAKSFLSYSSSIACQPIGCFDFTYCLDKNKQRFLVTVVGRHSLSLKEKHRWMDGGLPDSEVPSHVTTTRYHLVEGQLIEVESVVLQDVPSNINLFANGGKDGRGFEINTCL